MADMHHRLKILAEPERVWSALTTAEGLRSWWTADAEARPEVGSVAVFRFDQGRVRFRMRVDALDVCQRVVWTCVGGPDEWVGTTVTWTLHGVGDAETVVQLDHTGWAEASELFASCNTTWGLLMHHLKRYALGDSHQPYFRDGA